MQNTNGYSFTDSLYGSVMSALEGETHVHRTDIERVSADGQNAVILFTDNGDVALRRGLQYIPLPRYLGNVVRRAMLTGQ